jgi:hypothetical protein
MSATPSRAPLPIEPAIARVAARSFLRIVRHGTGPSAIYVVTYHRLDRAGVQPRPVLAEGAQALMDLLERIGVDFGVSEVRGAFEDILRFGSANIPDLWLSDQEMIEKGLVES